MIISASRRTDIPSYYSEWFFHRIKEKAVYARNPMNARQIKKISLDPDFVDCFVFWTKNPAPLLGKIQLLEKYAYYFQLTLNPYQNDIEKNLPNKALLIETFKKLSDKIGPQKIIWRYDPVLLNDKYDLAYHIDNFGNLAVALGGYTEKVIFSFMAFYKKIAKAVKLINAREIRQEEKHVIAENFSLVARSCNLIIDTCTEGADFSMYGIGKARCIDGDLVSKITGRAFAGGKDKNQRVNCGCVKSVDIGGYNTCANGCIYCYANYNHKIAKKNAETHNAFSSILTGNPPENDCQQVQGRQGVLFPQRA